MTSSSILPDNFGGYSHLMEKVVTDPDRCVAEVAMIAHRVVQMTNEFRYSSMQMDEYMGNGQVCK